MSVRAKVNLKILTSLSILIRTLPPSKTSGASAIVAERKARFAKSLRSLSRKAKVTSIISVARELFRTHLEKLGEKAKSQLAHLRKLHQSISSSFTVTKKLSALREQLEEKQSTQIDFMTETFKKTMSRMDDITKKLLIRGSSETS
jgi:hypothetical protein